MIRINRRFQLEVEKLGKKTIFQVTVYERTGTRSKGKRLFAETQVEDPYHFRVQFIVRDAPDFDSLLKTFLEQLAFRGYTPIRYRLKEEDNGWSDWINIPPSP